MDVHWHYSTLYHNGTLASVIVVTIDLAVSAEVIWCASCKIGVWLWIFRPSRKRCESATSTLGSFTIIIIAIQLPTASWTAPGLDGDPSLVLPDPGERGARKACSSHRSRTSRLAPWCEAAILRMAGTVR